MPVKTVNNHIRDHFLKSINYVEYGSVADLQRLRSTEWSKELEGIIRDAVKHYIWDTDSWTAFDQFVELMRNRLIMGAFRYGSFAGKSSEQIGRYDVIGSLEKKYGQYMESGNTEYLVDGANCALLDYLFEYSFQLGANSAFRGDMVELYEVSRSISMTKFISRAIEAYQREHDKVYLIRLICLLFVEFDRGVHLNKHFRATDDVEHMN